MFELIRQKGAQSKAISIAKVNVSIICRGINTTTIRASAQTRANGGFVTMPQRLLLVGVLFVNGRTCTDCMNGATYVKCQRREG